MCVVYIYIYIYIHIHLSLSIYIYIIFGSRVPRRLARGRKPPWGRGDGAQGARGADHRGQGRSEGGGQQAAPSRSRPHAVEEGHRAAGPIAYYIMTYCTIA